MDHAGIHYSSPHPPVSNKDIRPFASGQVTSKPPQTLPQRFTNMPTNMTALLTTAFLAATLLALPTSTTRILPRALPAEGVGQGDLYSQLTYTTYAEINCQGSGHTVTGGYGYYTAYQTQSYHLSRALRNNEVLDFYTGFGTGLPSKYSVDHAMDGDYDDACLQYDSTAGINATTHDNEGHGRHIGCHTLVNNEWCSNIYQTGDV